MKRRIRWVLVCLFVGFLLPGGLAAKTWNEITPGITKKTDVLTKLGAPTRDLNRGGAFSKGILYQEKQAPEGARQVQIFFDENDVVLAVHVFPKSELRKEQILKNFGSEYEEKLTDSFKTYFFFKKDGLVVYFQEGSEVVSSLTYQKPAAAGP